MNHHYDEIGLQDYLEEPEAFAGREALETHVGGCEECRAVLDGLKVFEAALSPERIREAHQEMTEEDMAAMEAMADLIDREDARAEELLGPFVASPALFRRANVAATPDLRTAGVVRRLCTESRQLRERQPMHALAMADAAVAIAEQLSTDDYPETLVDECRGDAWVERANALRYLGRHAEALDALDVAERSLSRSPVAIYVTAAVVHTRAVIHLETGKLAEARRLARRAARVFRRFGEDTKYIHARSIEGAVLFDQSRYREARDLFLSLLPLAKQLGDPPTLAGVFGNVANCELRLNHFDAANDSFERALSLYQSVGLQTELIRLCWNIGCLRIARGEIAEGLIRLRQAKREFERIGARSDAALVTLDIAEALLASGEPLGAREAADLCKGLVESFTAFGSTDHALTALAFLREAFESGKVTPALVRRVRDYLETRPDQNSVPFLPPPHL